MSDSKDNSIVSLIAAIGKNGELGKGNQLLFKIPEDMKFFKEKTNGHPIIMGRKTWESIGRALPNRTNIVISRDANNISDSNNQVIAASSIEDAIARARDVEGGEEIFIIGGAQIYQQAIQFADKIYLTAVDAEDKEADAFFTGYSDVTKINTTLKGSDEHYTETYIDLIK